MSTDLYLSERMGRDRAILIDSLTRQTLIPQDDDDATQLSSNKSSERFKPKLHAQSKETCF